MIRPMLWITSAKLNNIYIEHAKLQLALTYFHDYDYALNDCVPNDYVLHGYDHDFSMVMFMVMVMIVLILFILIHFRRRFSFNFISFNNNFYLMLMNLFIISLFFMTVLLVLMRDETLNVFANHLRAEHITIFILCRILLTTGLSH